MPKVALVQVVYNSLEFIPRVLPAALNQTEKDTQFYAVIAGNEDGGREHIEEHFPQVHIIDPGYNVGFARGHNIVFSSIDARYFQLINPDLIISTDFVENMLMTFDQSSRMGAVGGKLLQFNFKKDKPAKTIDSTGVIIRKTGRALDRGQHETDAGQHDQQVELMAVSGAAAMYHRDALEDIIEQGANGRPQYFDEGFHSYLEDVDLCWRMYNRGWKIRYQPQAVAWHGRNAGSSPGGYSRIVSYVRHRRAIPLQIRKLNYRNHIFMFVKNSPKWYLKFFGREVLYNVFVLFVEPGVLPTLADMLRQFPVFWRKRNRIKMSRRISQTEAGKLLG